APALPRAAPRATRRKSTAPSMSRRTARCGSARSPPSGSSGPTPTTCTGPRSGSDRLSVRAVARGRGSCEVAARTRLSRRAACTMRLFRLAATAFIAVLAAALAPGIVFAALTRSLAAGTFAFVIALPHALVLGLPLFLLLRAKKWVNAASSIAVGFAVGALPIVIVTVLFAPSREWSSSVLTALLLVASGAIG